MVVGKCRNSVGFSISREFMRKRPNPGEGPSDQNCQINFVSNIRHLLLLKAVNNLTFSLESNLWSGFVAPTGQAVGESLLQQ